MILLSICLFFDVQRCQFLHDHFADADQHIQLLILIVQICMEASLNAERQHNIFFRIILPISVHRWNPDSSTIEFLYQVVGEGTEKLAQLKQRDTFQLTGPMGNGFDVPDILSKYKKIAVVGGGIGTAPMFQLTRELAAAGVKPDVFFGFRDAPYCMEEYREIANLVKVSTDTGAVGFHGFVTQLYDPADYDVVLVCGPTVMMKNAARLCAEKGTPCFVSMEKKMACGIGACLGCTCETKGG